MASYRRKGLLFILVGPTGAGKNTIMNAALNRLKHIRQLPTATTRAIRENEQEGREHYFLTREAFEELIANDGLLEHQNVHGRLYGVPRVTVAQAIDAEQDRIADIDVLGAMNVRAAFPDNTVIIFVQPGASDDVMGTLRDRLNQRGEKSEEIERRLERVPLEMSYAPLCDYLIINEDLDEATETLCSIVIAERSRRALLNLRARKDHPRHRVHQMSAVLVTQNDKVLLRDGQIPMLATVPGEFPSDTAKRLLNGILQPTFQQPLGITTAPTDHYDHLTIWYHADATPDITLPDGWTWGEMNPDAVPMVIRNQLGSLTY
jgi:guanylate kinase